jgi:hypothetical protein
VSKGDFDLDKLFDAFSASARPTQDAITDGSPGDREREKVAELLAPYTNRDVPDAVFENYEIRAMLPILTAQAYRYFMPRCIQYALSHADFLGTLLISIGRESEYDDRISSFLPRERAAIMRFVDHVSRLSDSSLYRDELKTARKTWGFELRIEKPAAK